MELRRASSSRRLELRRASSVVMELRPASSVKEIALDYLSTGDNISAVDALHVAKPNRERERCQLMRYLYWERANRFFTNDVTRLLICSLVGGDFRAYEEFLYAAGSPLERIASPAGSPLERIASRKRKMTYIPDIRVSTRYRKQDRITVFPEVENLVYDSEHDYRMLKELNKFIYDAAINSSNMIDPIIEGLCKYADKRSVEWTRCPIELQTLALLNELSATRGNSVHSRCMLQIINKYHIKKNKNLPMSGNVVREHMCTLIESRILLSNVRMSVEDIRYALEVLNVNAEHICDSMYHNIDHYITKDLRSANESITIQRILERPVMFKTEPHKFRAPLGWSQFIGRPLIDAILRDVWHSIKDLNIVPKRQKVLSFMDNLPLEMVNVVIIGQDPYDSETLATGLAFSIPRDKPLTASLKNIEKAIISQFSMSGSTCFRNGSLEFWKRQGVLLINSALTTTPGSNSYFPPSSGSSSWQMSKNKRDEKHYDIWKPFILNLIEYINNSMDGVVFMFWGYQASMFRKESKFVERTKNLYLEAAHPVNRSGKFADNNNFVVCNEFLIENGKRPIKWWGGP
ncbi:unnamed protein product [Sphagnum troendelagicum]